MSSNRLKQIADLTSLSILGFWIFSPISILAFPVTVLVSHQSISWIELSIWGFFLTLVAFSSYLPFTYLQSKLTISSDLAKSLFFILVIALVGAIRGLVFYAICEFQDFSVPGSLLNRVLASTLTTLVWLTPANLLVNNSRSFKFKYQRALQEFLRSKGITSKSGDSDTQAKQDLIQFQRNLSDSVKEMLSQENGDKLEEISSVLTYQINKELRPLSQRIWLRSISEYPKVKRGQLIHDAIRFLDFSQFHFLTIMLCLAFFDNLFIRSVKESALRTLIYLIVILIILITFKIFAKLNKSKNLQFIYIFLAAIGTFPLIASEYLGRILGFSGDWIATLLISPIAPVVIIILSMNRLFNRDHHLIIEILQRTNSRNLSSTPNLKNTDERNLASYLHNSLQSELLALAEQLREAAYSDNIENSSKLLQKVSAVIDRSFIDDFAKFTETPIERLEHVRSSWDGIIDIEIIVPEEFLKEQSRNAILVQIIEEFATNSYRHGQASKMQVTCSKGDNGIKLFLQNNAKKARFFNKGIGTAWLDQIALAPWVIGENSEGTFLAIEI